MVACRWAAATGSTRTFRESAAARPRPSDVAVSDLHPGGGSASPSDAITPYEKNAVALSEGKRLFSAYNCAVATPTAAAAWDRR